MGLGVLCNPGFSFTLREKLWVVFDAANLLPRVRHAVIQTERPSEDELAGVMLQRIENGDLALEDIPVRLARYGLMEPNAFVDEMRERMEMAKEDTEQ